MDWLRHATKLAAANPTTLKAKMAAVIVKRGRLLGLGFNQTKTHPLQSQFGAREQCIFLHAEIDAIRNTLRTHTLGDLQGSTMYVARTWKDGTPALAKPCLGCARAIIHFGIRKVVHT